jgi:peptide chain release factor 1
MKNFEKECSVRYTKGSGPGGQHRNKVETCVIVVHKPTGLQEKCEDGRSKLANYKLAMQRLEKKVEEHHNKIKLEKMSALRLEKIKNAKVIRTYNFNRNSVKDHRTGKIADLNRVLNGELDLINI